MSYQRFGVFFVPRSCDLARFGAEWLGWDVNAGTHVASMNLPGRPEATAAPRKYGLHATLKAPFRLHRGTSRSALEHALSELAATCAPVRCDGLVLARLGRFLALVPRGDSSGLSHLAAACVTRLDLFRAPASADELARRRGHGLRPDLEANLTRWGYPFVLDAFRFHVTLTGRLAGADLAHWEAVLAQALPRLPAPFEVSEIALVGERADGLFEVLRRFPLVG